MALAVATKAASGFTESYQISSHIKVTAVQ